MQIIFGLQLAIWSAAPRCLLRGSHCVGARRATEAERCCSLQVKAERERCGKLQQELAQAQTRVGALQQQAQKASERARELSNRLSLVEAQTAQLQKDGGGGVGAQKDNDAHERAQSRARGETRDASTGTDVDRSALSGGHTQAVGGRAESQKATAPPRPKATQDAGSAAVRRQEASENSGADNGASQQGASYAAKEQVAAAERKVAALRRKLTQRNEEAAALQRTHETQAQRCAQVLRLRWGCCLVSHTELLSGMPTRGAARIWSTQTGSQGVVA